MGRYPKNYSPLMAAAEGGHISALKYLIDEGADFSLQDDRGFGVMEHAASYQRYYVIRFLHEWKGLSLQHTWRFAQGFQEEELGRFVEDLQNKDVAPKKPKDTQTRDDEPDEL